jgi:hypothetical protein
MGRQVRRVPADFAWPLNVPYGGFLRPDDIRLVQCPTCGGDGMSREARDMYQRWWGHVPFSPHQTGSTPFTAEDPEILAYARAKIMDSRAFYDAYLGSAGEETARREAARLCLIWNGMWQHHLSQEDVDALLAADHLEGLTHRYCYDTRSWIPLDRPVPTQREVNLWTLNLGKGFPLSVPGYDIHKAEAARRDVPMECAACSGEGETFRDDAHRNAFDGWEPVEPPVGEAWQMWETVSEGSPVTPPCATPEALARLLAHEDAVRDDGMGYEGWLAFIMGAGWSPTGMGSGGTMVPGHLAIAQDL